ncbi:MAG: hypothetical protein CUN55_06920 [Phototrophicales bacterium]|nr:MAG: hypothetical protein CUN55_06920 [Phototrophicales bacterium]
MFLDVSTIIYGVDRNIRVKYIQLIQQNRTVLLMLVYIMVMSGPDDGLVLKLQQPINPDNNVAVFSIGRRETCDVCIAFDTSVSRLHARLLISEDKKILLTDEDSRNGTFIGRQRIKEPTFIQAGELFRVGNTWLRIQSIEKD